MVSRRHAELRRQNGSWYLTDLNSSYGTYLNEEQLTAPSPVQVGSRVRIGQSGPVLRRHMDRIRRTAARCSGTSSRRRESLKLHPPLQGPPSCSMQRER